MQYSLYATIEDEKAKKEFKTKVMEKERNGIKTASRRFPKQIKVGYEERFRNQIPEEVRRREKAARAAWKRQRFGSNWQKPIVWNVERVAADSCSNLASLCMFSPYPVYLFCLFLSVVLVSSLILSAVLVSSLILSLSFLLSLVSFSSFLSFACQTNFILRCFVSWSLSCGPFSVVLCSNCVVLSPLVEWKFLSLQWEGQKPSWE